MRRSTLGTLNIGNQNRQIVRERKTSLGTRPSIGGRRPSSSGRASLANPRSRPSSQYGRENCAQMKDTRPLSDRGYQQKMIRYLMEFLTDFNYPHQISMRILSAPSMKEFCNIFQFLYKYIKGDTQKTTALESKPADEIPKIFKMLGYPFSISKSNLQSVGSPHAWPIILGALCWLIELVRLGLSVGHDVEGHVMFPEDNYGAGVEYQDDGPQPEDKFFFSYLDKGYAAFMAGQELDELGEYDNEFVQNIRSRNAAMLDGMEDLVKENMVLEEELNALESDSSRLQKLSERKTTLISDREKFINYVGDLGKHKKQLEDVNSQLTEELQGLKMEEEAAMQENSMLQNTLNNQELSAADVERMKHEKRELQKTVEQLEKNRDYFDQQIWEKEMQYAKNHEESEKHIREYNEMARKLKLIPPTAENAKGFDFEMHFNPHSLRPDQGALTDFKGTIKPALLRLRQQISEKSRAVKSQVVTEEETCDQISDMVADKQEEVAALEMKLQTLDKDLEWKKEIMAKEYQKSSGTAQGLEECVQQMRAKVLKCEEAEEQQKEELKELKLRAEGNKVKLESEKEEYSTFILKACQVIKEHKMLIQNRIHEVLEQSNDELEQTKQQQVVSSSFLLSKYRQKEEEEEEEHITLK
ncbi:kinetochore protein NDC80 homolog isoform X2 [Acropora muricata]|uniref:kinetochore protein NDC80 homolog isoform X2 n=1 Tax=Acropora muricata TaxID=159855 RepID=UPI0034E5FDBC